MLSKTPLKPRRTLSLNHNRLTLSHSKLSVTALSASLVKFYQARDPPAHDPI